jgi:hypothetical protein
MHCTQVLSRMQRTHFDLLNIVRTDLAMLGFPPSACRALDDHEAGYTAKDAHAAGWFNVAANYLGATEAALQVRYTLGLVLPCTHYIQRLHCAGTVHASTSTCRTRTTYRGCTVQVLQSNFAHSYTEALTCAHTRTNPTTSASWTHVRT